MIGGILSHLTKGYHGVVCEDDNKLRISGLYKGNANLKGLGKMRRTSEQPVPWHRPEPNKYKLGALLLNRSAGYLDDIADQKYIHEEVNSCASWVILAVVPFGITVFLSHMGIENVND
jgi:hypothetical protein